MVAALGAVVPIGPGGPEERLIRGAGERAWWALVLDPWIVGDEYRDGNVPGGVLLACTPTERMRQYALLCNPDFIQGSGGHYWDYLPRQMVLTAVTALTTLGLRRDADSHRGRRPLLPVPAPRPPRAGAPLAEPGPVASRAAADPPDGGGAGVGALAAQVVLMAVLGLMLLLTPAVWVPAAPLGWLAEGTLMALLAAVLYRYRF